jgi:dUTPase
VNNICIIPARGGSKRIPRKNIKEFNFRHTYRDICQEFINLFETNFINMRVKAEMFYYDKGGVGVSSAFYMFPRSSISKTPLMMANHTGIIDMGYRGDLLAAFRYLYNSPLCTTYEVATRVKTKYIVEKNTRLVQICHPSLCPIFVKIMENMEDLSSTQRNTGGFGSTS